MEGMRSFKVFITGSSGFIGTHLVFALSEAGMCLKGIDIVDPRYKLPGNFVFENCDIRGEDAIADSIEKFEPDAVIHLAARTDLDGKDLQSYSANIEGVRNLIAATKSCPSVKRCIYTSSQLVCRVGYVPRDEFDYCPNTLYGQSKVLTEKIVRETDGGEMEWCLVRPTTIWGPGMSAHYQRFFHSIKSGWYFHVGRRPLYKSYGYVGNTVHQYMQLLQADSATIKGKTFYLADYQPISLRAWADSFQKALAARPIPTLPVGLGRFMARIGDSIQKIGIESFPFTSFRLNNILTEYQFDMADSESVCGPLPYTMDEGVAKTVAWFQETGALD